MRVLSIGQPWATLIVRDVKRFEARSWSTPFRGEIAIHASSSIKRWVRELVEEDPALRRALRKAGIDDTDALPRSAIVGTAVIREVQRLSNMRPAPSEQSLALCAYPKRSYFLWELGAPKELRTPIAAKGKLNLWPLSDAIAARVVRTSRRGGWILRVHISTEASIANVLSCQS
jgi:hypothetical protein